MNELKANVGKASGKFWPKIKRVAQAVGTIAVVVISSPLKLPKAVKGVAQYLALLAGIVDAVNVPKDGE